MALSVILWSIILLVLFSCVILLRINHKRCSADCHSASWSTILLSVVLLNIILLSVHHGRYSADCHSAECHSVECHGTSVLLNDDKMKTFICWPYREVR
jgi:hypothetical protein